MVAVLYVAFDIVFQDIAIYWSKIAYFLPYVYLLLEFCQVFQFEIGFSGVSRGVDFLKVC